jgi:hypothetical protein
MAADGAVNVDARSAQIKTTGGNTRTAWKALDWDVSTSWCQKDPRAGVPDDLEIEFDQPVRVKEIEIIRSQGKTTTASAVQIFTDSEEVLLDFEGYKAFLPVQAPQLQQPTRKLRVRPLPAKSPHCIADIVIRLHDGPWVSPKPMGDDPGHDSLLRVTLSTSAGGVSSARSRMVGQPTKISSTIRAEAHLATSFGWLRFPAAWVPHDQLFEAVSAEHATISHHKSDRRHHRAHPGRLRLGARQHLGAVKRSGFG